MPDNKLKLSASSEAVGGYLKQNQAAAFLVFCEGDVRDVRNGMISILKKTAHANQILSVGKLSCQERMDDYAAVDCFVFASQTETQRIVLAEAMASGKAVIALDGLGVREVVEDGSNGVLLPSDAPASTFTESLGSLFKEEATLRTFAEAAKQTAKAYDTEACAERMREAYEQMISEYRTDRVSDLPDFWQTILADLEVEWDLAVAKSSAICAVVKNEKKSEVSLD